MSQHGNSWLRADLEPNEKLPEPILWQSFTWSLCAETEWVQRLVVLLNMESLSEGMWSVLPEDTNGLECREQRLGETRLERSRINS